MTEEEAIQQAYDTRTKLGLPDAGIDVYPYGDGWSFGLHGIIISFAYWLEWIPAPKEVYYCHLEGRRYAISYSNDAKAALQKALAAYKQTQEEEHRILMSALDAASALLR
jgi:hypothetical protein